MKALEKLHDISKTLHPFFIESHDKEAEIILKNALDMSLVNIYRDNPELTSDQMHSIEQIISRRINREPLQYILGHVDFAGLKLHVGHGVLIPRPETELLAELAINRVNSQESRVKDQIHNSNLLTLNSIQNSQLRILDLCTGSGCLALALAKEFPDAQVFGTDISEIALGYARRNADSNGINNVTFLQGNLFEPFTSSLHHFSHFFDLIISNPPYIKSDDIKNLQTEIKDWEPLNALDGGTDGLDFYRAIIPTARQFLKTAAYL